MAGARDWIGERGDMDRLDVVAITASLKPEAADLIGIVNKTSVSVLFEIRRTASSAAVTAMTWFKRLTRIAVVGGAIAALASGLLLYGAGADAPAPSGAAPQAQEAALGLVGWVKRNHTEIIVLQIIGLALSAGAAVLLSQLRYAETWSENRNKSERLRNDIFNTVLSEAQKLQPTSLAVANDGNPIAQAMEFFRRYQHELQTAFYDKGSQRHAKATVILAWIGAVLAAIAAVSGGVSSLGGSALIVGAFLGIAIPILLGALQTWRITAGDSAKAATAYTVARDALLELQKDLDDVRKSAALADGVAVRAYFDKVHLVMTTEHDAWKATGAKPKTP